MSISILDQLFIHLPYLIKNKNGIMNFVSPGFISLYDIIKIYNNQFSKNINISLIDYNFDKHREISCVKSNYVNIELTDVYQYLNNNISKYNE